MMLDDGCQMIFNKTFGDCCSGC